MAQAAYLDVIGGSCQLIRSGKECEHSYLDEPCPLPKPVQSKLVSDLSGVHSIGKILLVGEDKEQGVPELIFVQHPLQFLASLRNTFPIVRVDDEDDTLGVLEIWEPSSPTLERNWQGVVQDD